MGASLYRPRELSCTEYHPIERCCWTQLGSNGPLRPAAITRASDLAVTTGDMAGLSPVDLELLALTIERAATLVTDDYRLQNLCERGGLPWLSVTMEGISALWSWELRCTGCGAVLPSPEGPNSSRELGECADCGSALRLSRKRG